MEKLGPGLDAAGPVDSPPIVLLHGGGLNRKMWAPQMERLSESFRVLAPDLPGHGARSAQAFTLDAAVAAVSDIVRMYMPGSPIIVGLSLGGYVAISHAERMPDQVSGLVLSGCCVDYSGWLRIAARVNACALKFYPQARLYSAQEKRLRALYPATIVDELLEEGAWKEGARQGLLEVARTKFHPKLATIDTPILLLTGEKDTLNRRAGAVALERTLMGRLQLLHGAGHLCNLDRPDGFSKAVAEFTEYVSGVDRSQPL